MNNSREVEQEKRQTAQKHNEKEGASGQEKEVAMQQQSQSISKQKHVQTHRHPYISSRFRADRAESAGRQSLIDCLAWDYGTSTVLEIHTAVSDRG